MPHEGSTILLATSPGTLVRLAFHDEAGTPGRTFAYNLRVRSAVLYTLSYGSMIIDARGGSCTRTVPGLNRPSLLLDYTGIKVVSPARPAPAAC